MRRTRCIIVLGVLTLVISLVACGSLGDLGAQADNKRPIHNEPSTDVEGDLLGTEWVLISLNGSGLLDDTVTLVIDNNGVVMGYGGCNNYSVRQVAIGKGSFRAFQVLHEDRGCPGEGFGQQEDAYLEALGNSAYYRIEDGRLEIQDAAGETTLVYATRE